MKKINTKKAQYWKNWNDAITDIVGAGGSIEFHPIPGDPFGDGIPRMITIIKKGN